MSRAEPARRSDAAEAVGLQWANTLTNGLTGLKLPAGVSLAAYTLGGAAPVRIYLLARSLSFLSCEPVMAVQLTAVIVTPEIRLLVTQQQLDRVDALRSSATAHSDCHVLDQSR